MKTYTHAKNLYTNVHSNIMCNSEKVKTIQNVHQLVNGSAKYGNSYNEIFFSSKREEVLTHATTWLNHENIILSE